MTTITNGEELFRYAARARGRVVLITGAAAGPARDAALIFAQNGANVVIGDIYATGAENMVDFINKLPPGSGKACWKRCDVTNWEDQAALFQYATKKFGGIDIVIAGARVGEMQSLGTLQVSKKGNPIKPDLKTLDVNLTGAIYTTHLALHYLPKTRSPVEPLKYVILLGYLAPWPIQLDKELFNTSQHGLLSFARSVQPILTIHGVDIATVQIPSLPGHGNADLASRTTAYVMFFCATNPDPSANGSVWGLLPNGVVQRMEEIPEMGMMPPELPPEYPMM